jgi:hypothetical protein
VLQIFHLWLNTAFVEKNYLCFDKKNIDKLNKDKHHKKVDKSFAVEIFLQCVADEEITGTEVGQEEQEDEMDDDDDDDQ